jgi:uncharacterized cofD-like protein
MKKPKIVTIGGGSGTFVVLSGLKKYPITLQAVVSMMDSGGSTGRLRDQLGVLPPGDMRQALIALSDSEDIWRSLFTYRFDTGDLGGHNFGNIFLSALEKITGSAEESLVHAAKLLKIRGHVIPVTSSQCILCAKYADGSLLEGETLIDESLTSRPKILYMYTLPEAVPNQKAIKSILKADYIVFGPGDLYTSIFPNLLIPGIVDALKVSKAKKVFFVNLMTKIGQTDGFKASDFVNEMERYAGCTMDYIFVNNQNPPADLLECDLGQSTHPKTRIIRADLLSESKYEQSIADRIRRSLIRHDPEKVSKVLIESLNIKL